VSLSLAQHSSGNGSTSASATITTPTVGNLIVIAIDVVGNVANISPPSGYTLTGTANNTTVNGCKMYARVADGTEGTSVSASCSGASNTSITYAEYHSTNGVFTTAAADKTGSTTNTSGTSLASSSITPTKPAFVLASCFRSTSSTLTSLAVTNSLTIEEQQRGSRDDYADLLVSGGSGAYTTTWSWSASSNTGAGCIIAAFLEPPIVATPSGLTTSQSFGSITIKTAITTAMSGLATSQSLGSPAIVPGAVICTVVGLGSGQGFYTPQENQKFSLAGISTGQAFGVLTAQTAMVVPVSGIPTEQAFGVYSVYSLTYADRLPNQHNDHRALANQKIVALTYEQGDADTASLQFMP
jgi:hypothetical protein